MAPGIAASYQGRAVVTIRAGCGEEAKSWPDWCCHSSVLLPALRLVLPLLAGSTRAEDMDEAAERATITVSQGEVTFGLLDVKEEPSMTLAEIIAHREALVKMGLVRWTGTYREDRDDVPQRVWEAIPEAEVTNPEGLAFLDDQRRPGTR